MTYEELVKTLKDTYESADASEVKEHIAIQFNVKGEGEGAFYLEIADGKVNIQPYEYYDRDVLVTTQAKDLLDIFAGKMDFVDAFNNGVIGAEGNLIKALSLKDVLEKYNKAPKKSLAKKVKSAASTVKAAKKVATAKKETAAKETVKKETVKKTTAKKATK